MFQTAKCQQNQLSASQHLPRPAEPQSAVVVRQQIAKHQQGAVCISALHQDSVSKKEFVHLKSVALQRTVWTATADAWVHFIFVVIFVHSHHLRLSSPSHLAQNPFMCDCHLKWLADYLFDNPIETSGARCSHPRRLANKRISQVKGKKFRCTGKTSVKQLEIYSENTGNY